MVNDGLPSSNVVCLYGVKQESIVLLENLQKYFSTQEGYKHKMVFQPDATIEDLKTLPKCSIFVYSSHNLYNTVAGKHVFAAIATATPDTKENRAKYKKEITGGLICTATELDKDPLPDNCLWITEKFAKTYWRFETNSFVFINGCYSSDPRLADTILKKPCGASVFGGWTGGSTGGTGDLAVEYLFDRLLGANMMEDKESPPQRPFNWTLVLADMSKKNLLQAWDLDDKAWSALQIRASGSGDLGLLAPSIAYLDMDDEKKKLILTGSFGKKKGEVRIGKNPKGIDNSPVKIDKWTATSIECTIPNEGDSASGRVTVHVNNIESNPRFLTEWRGDTMYECRWNDPPVAGNISGTLTLTVNTTLHFRADVADYRQLPGEAPIYRQMLIVSGADDSTCSWKASGDYCIMEPFKRDKRFYYEQWDKTGNEKVKRAGAFYMLCGLIPSMFTLPVEYDVQARKAFKAKTSATIPMSFDSWRDVSLLIPPQWREEADPYPMAVYDQDYRIPDLHKGPTECSEPPPFPWVYSEVPLALPKCTVTYQRNAILATANTVPDKDAAR